MFKDKTNRLLFIIFVTIISVLLYLRDLDNLNISKFILLGIVVLYALVADYKHIFMMTAFILPLTNGMPSNYLMPVLCVLLIIKGGRQVIVPPMAWISFAIVVAFELLHYCLYGSEAPGIPVLVGYISALFLLFYVGSVAVSHSDNAQLALCFCIGGVVMLSIILLNFQGMIGDELLEEGVRIGDVEKFSGVERMTLRTNANNIGLYSIATISLSFVLWYYRKISLGILALIAIPSFVAGVFSVSRTWILSLVLFGLLFFVFSRKRSFGSFVVLLVSIVGVCWFFIDKNASALEVFTERFTGANINTAGQRTTLFSEYHRWMMMHPKAILWGCGALTYRIPTIEIMNSIHNSFQQIFVAYGLPGLFFFIYLLIRFIRKWGVAKELQGFVPMIVIIFFLQSLQFLYPSYCMYPLIGSFFILKMLKSNNSVTR